MDRKRTICLGMVCAAALGCATAGWADEAPVVTVPDSAAAANDLRYNPPAWPDAPDTAAMLRRLVYGTASVLGLCVCTLLIGRRWLRGIPAGQPSGMQLRLVESVSLGNRCTVHLVQVSGQRVLVGTDAAGLKSLVPLPVPFEQTLAEATPMLAEREKSEAVAN